MAQLQNSPRFFRKGPHGAILAAAVACTAGSVPEHIPESAPDEPQETPSGTLDSEVAQEADTAAPVAPLVRGRLLDPGLDPLADLPVRLCNLDGCYDAPTTSGGVFTFVSLPPGRYAASNPTVPGSSPAADALAWSPFFDYVDVAEDGTLDWRNKPWIVPQVMERYVPTHGVQTLSFAGGASRSHSTPTRSCGPT